MNIRPAKQLWLPFDIKGGLFTSKADTASPVEKKIDLINRTAVIRMPGGVGGGES